MAADIDRLLDGPRADTLRTETEQYPELRRALLAAGAELAQVEDSWTDTLSAPELAAPRSSGGVGIVWILAVAAMLFAVVLWVGRENAEQAELTQEEPRPTAASTSAIAEVLSDAGQETRKQTRLDAGMPQLDSARPPSKPRLPERGRSVRRQARPGALDVVTPPPVDVRIERTPTPPEPAPVPAKAVDEADIPSELM